VIHLSVIAVGSGFVVELLPNHKITNIIDNQPTNTQTNTQTTQTQAKIRKNILINSAELFFSDFRIKLNTTRDQFLNTLLFFFFLTFQKSQGASGLKGNLLKGPKDVAKEKLHLFSFHCNPSRANSFFLILKIFILIGLFTLFFFHINPS